MLFVLHLLPPQDWSEHAQWVFTYEQLAVEAQAQVTVRLRLQEAQRQLVHLQQRLLHVPLGPDVVPLPVVQGEVGLNGENGRTVAHVKGECDHGGSCGRRQRWRWAESQRFKEFKSNKRSVTETILIHM